MELTCSTLTETTLELAAGLDPGHGPDRDLARRV